MAAGRENHFHFLAGVLMTTLGVVLFAAGLVMHIGPERVGRALRLVPAAEFKLPAPIRDELARAGAVGDNFSDLSAHRQHHTFFVEPDPVLGYKLRANVSADVTVLAGGPPTLDPPSISVPANTVLSLAARDYLSRHGLLHLRYTTDADGMRLTLPVVSSNDKVLIIGDSVAFGVGVNDIHTSSSVLQLLLGESTQVVNGGVPGYTGRDAILRAAQLTAHQKYRALVYIACQNDFLKEPREWDSSHDWRGTVTTVLDQLKAISGSVDRVAIFLTTNLQYEARYTVAASLNWPHGLTDQIDQLRAELPAMARRYEFDYGEWSPIAAAEVMRERTPWAAFSLYADDVHFSPRGNQLLAKHILNLTK